MLSELVVICLTLVQENAERSLAAQRQKQARAVKRVETCRKELSRKKALKEGAGSSSMAELAHIDNEILFRQLQDASKTMLHASSLPLPDSSHQMANHAHFHTCRDLASCECL